MGNGLVMDEYSFDVFQAVYLLGSQNGEFSMARYCSCMGLWDFCLPIPSPVC
jgi:hypothetical protein